MDQDIANMTGESHYKKPKLLKLDSLKLNGETGRFKITRLTQPKGEDGRYKVEEIESPVNVVFLKVRRRLIEADRDGLAMQTAEHNTPNDTTMLFKRNEKSEKGVARALREQYGNLRTEQIVYARYKGEVVRLHVKGASLGSDRKDPTTTDFYSYLQSFAEGDHWFTTMTRLAAVEEGDQKRYWCIDFQRGEALTDDQVEEVKKQLREVHENCTEFDDYYKTETVEAVDKEAGGEDRREVPDYPEEDINPEDIPF